MALRGDVVPARDGHSWWQYDKTVTDHKPVSEVADPVPALVTGGAPSVYLVDSRKGDRWANDVGRTPAHTRTEAIVYPGSGFGWWAPVEGQTVWEQFERFFPTNLILPVFSAGSTDRWSLSQTNSSLSDKHYLGTTLRPITNAASAQYTIGSLVIPWTAFVNDFLGHWVTEVNQIKYSANSGTGFVQTWVYVDGQPAYTGVKTFGVTLPLDLDGVYRANAHRKFGLYRVETTNTQTSKHYISGYRYGDTEADVLQMRFVKYGDGGGGGGTAPLTPEHLRAVGVDGGASLTADASVGATSYEWVFDVPLEQLPSAAAAVSTATPALVRTGYVNGSSHTAFIRAVKVASGVRYASAWSAGVPFTAGVFGKPLGEFVDDFEGADVSAAAWDLAASQGGPTVADGNLVVQPTGAGKVQMLRARREWLAEGQRIYWGPLELGSIAAGSVGEVDVFRVVIYAGDPADLNYVVLKIRRFDTDAVGHVLFPMVSAGTANATVGDVVYDGATHVAALIAADGLSVKWQKSNTPDVPASWVDMYTATPGWDFNGAAMTFDVGARIANGTPAVSPTKIGGVNVATVAPPPPPGASTATLEAVTGDVRAVVLQHVVATEAAALQTNLATLPFQDLLDPEGGGIADANHRMWLLAKRAPAVDADSSFKFDRATGWQSHPILLEGIDSQAADLGIMDQRVVQTASGSSHASATHTTTLPDQKVLVVVSEDGAAGTWDVAPVGWTRLYEHKLGTVAMAAYVTTVSAAGTPTQLTIGLTSGSAPAIMASALLRPGVASAEYTSDDIAALAATLGALIASADGPAGEPQLRSLGSGASQAAEGNRSYTQTIAPASYGASTELAVAPLVNLLVIGPTTLTASTVFSFTGLRPVMILATFIQGAGGPWTPAFSQLAGALEQFPSAVGTRSTVLLGSDGLSLSVLAVSHAAPTTITASVGTFNSGT